MEDFSTLAIVIFLIVLTLCFGGVLFVIRQISSNRTLNEGQKALFIVLAGGAELLVIVFVFFFLKTTGI